MDNISKNFAVEHSVTEEPRVPLLPKLSTAGDFSADIPLSDKGIFDEPEECSPRHRRSRESDNIPKPKGMILASNAFFVEAEGICQYERPLSDGSKIVFRCTTPVWAPGKRRCADHQL